MYSGYRDESLTHPPVSRARPVLPARGRSLPALGALVFQSAGTVRRKFLGSPSHLPAPIGTAPEQPTRTVQFGHAPSFA